MLEATFLIILFATVSPVQARPSIGAWLSNFGYLSRRQRRLSWWKCRPLSQKIPQKRLVTPSSGRLLKSGCFRRSALVWLRLGVLERRVGGCSRHRALGFNLNVRGFFPTPAETPTPTP